MQPITVIVLACLVAVVAASVNYEPIPAEEQLYETAYDVPEHERSPRTKRGLILLKKKLLLGALGLKAVKVGAGVAGLYALKKGHDKKAKSHTTLTIQPSHSQTGYVEIQSNHGRPTKHVEVHSWSG